MNLPELCNSSSEWDRSSAAMWNCIELRQCLRRGMAQHFNQFYYQGDGAVCKAFTYGCWKVWAERSVASGAHKHCNLPPGMLILSHFKDSFERSSHSRKWFCCGDAVLCTGVKRCGEIPIAYYIVSYDCIIVILTDICLGGRLNDLHCAILWYFQLKIFRSKLWFD